MRTFRCGCLLVCSLFTAQLWAVEWEIPVTDLQVFRVRAKAAKLSVQRVEGTVIRVTVSGPQEDEWHQSVANQSLVVQGPENNGSVENTKVSIDLPTNVPATEMAFEEVRADLRSVSRLSLSALKGKIAATSTGEGVRYFIQQGEVQSSQHLGSLDIESYGGKIVINDGQSSLKIRLFGGELQLNKNQGSVVLESQSSTAKINGLQGNLNVLWGKGALVINEFAGRLEGSSKDGQVQVAIKPEAMVDLQAARGKVSITLPTDSGANVNLRSSGGALTVPGPLKVGKEGRFKVVRGKLSGASKGSISVNTEEAAVVIR